jgi:hypothetical protein
MAEQKIVSKIIEPDTGIRTPNYVAGRLLTPEDLKADQEANQRRDAILGQAAGYGVIEGFWVTDGIGNAGKTQLTVSAGRAVSRAGDLLELNTPTHSFSVQLDAPLNATFQSVNETGAYLLTVAAAEGYIGTVPTFSIERTAVKRRISRWDDSDGCTNQWRVDGLEFKLFYLSKTQSNAQGFENNTNDNPNQRRSRLAHWCFGSSSSAWNPFGSAASTSGIALSAAALGIDLEHDIPLAVLFWNSNAIEFVDNWSVRRRLVRPTPPSAPLFAFNTTSLTDALAAMGEARLLQFQEQLDKLPITDTEATEIEAPEYFRYLPPTGYLPLTLSLELTKAIIQDVFNRVLLVVQKYVVPEDGALPVFLEPVGDVTQFDDTFSIENHKAVSSTANEAVGALDRNVNRLAHALGFIADLRPVFSIGVERFYDAFQESQDHRDLLNSVAQKTDKALSLTTFFSSADPAWLPWLKLSYAPAGHMQSLVEQSAGLNAVATTDLRGLDIVLPDSYRLSFWSIALDWLDHNYHDIKFNGLPLTFAQFDYAWRLAARSEVFGILGVDPAAVVKDIRDGLQLPPFYALFAQALPTFMQAVTLRAPQPIGIPVTEPPAGGGNQPPPGEG